MPFVVAGALAGIISVVVFAAVHAMTISDIWFSLPIMAIAGALVGTALAWSYQVMGNAMRVSRWLAYSGSYLGLLVTLGVGSLIVYEPVSTMRLLTGVMGLQEADRLVGEALPLMIVLTVAGSATLTLLFGRSWWHFFPNLLTMILVMALVGSNVVIIGLIELDSSAIPALIEFMGLVVVIIGVYAGVMAAVVQRTQGSQPRSPKSSALSSR